MENTNKSNSLEQAEAERVIFSKIEEVLKFSLKANPR